MKCAVRRVIADNSAHARCASSLMGFHQAFCTRIWPPLWLPSVEGHRSRVEKIVAENRELSAVFSRNSALAVRQLTGAPSAT